MVGYNAGVFSALSQTPLGQDLWKFINQSETLVRMETATELGRPAVEGIEEQLLGHFGADILEDRTKQMVGHMVRQVMERRGYVIAAQNVKVTSGAPFSRATRYKLPDDLTFFVFRSTSDPRSIAL